MKAPSVITSLLLVLSSLACWRSTATTPTVTVTVPQGYRGWIVVRPSPAQTTTANPDPNIVVDEKGQAAIPESVLSDWHKVQGRYSDGTVLPAAGFDRGSASTVMLREGTVISRQGLGPIWTFFVGTEEEMRRQEFKLPAN